MKAQSASMTLYHILPGHHREATMWHDADHKAEVIGAMANVHISQRWVIPPDWLSLRSAPSLPENGGEYVNLYWSTGTAAELERDFGKLGDDLTRVGRMVPAEKYMQLTWPSFSSAGRLEPHLLQSAPDVELSGEAVTASTATTGLLVSIAAVRNDDKRESFTRWHDEEYLPMVLETGLFTGVAKLNLVMPGDYGHFVTLHYLDTPAPPEEYATFKEHLAEWKGSQRLARQDEASYDVILESLSAPSIGHYEYYD